MDGESIDPRRGGVVAREACLPGTAIGLDQPASEIGCHRLASDGWKIELEKRIVDHGSVMLSLPRKKGASTTSFYPITTT